MTASVRASLAVAGDVLLYLGIAALGVAAIGFTTPLEPPLREIAEYCFLGWWIPFLAGYALRKAFRKAG